MQNSSGLSRPTLRRAFLLVTASLILAAGAQSATKTPVTNFSKSPISMVDLTNMMFVVTVKGTNLDVYITSQTRFFKEGKPAISSDFKVGDDISGSLKKGDKDHFEAVHLYTGELKKAPVRSSGAKRTRSSKSAKTAKGAKPAGTVETPAKSAETPGPATEQPVTPTVEPTNTPPSGPALIPTVPGPIPTEPTNKP